MGLLKAAFGQGCIFSVTKVAAARSLLTGGNISSARLLAA